MVLFLVVSGVLLYNKFHTRNFSNKKRSHQVSDAILFELPGEEFTSSGVVDVPFSIVAPDDDESCLDIQRPEAPRRAA